MTALTTLSPGDAAICETPDDLARPPARRLIRRALGVYLDAEGVTASELIADPDRLDALVGLSYVTDEALTRVARLQVTRFGGDSRERRRALDALVIAARDRAQAAATDPDPDAAARHAILRQISTTSGWDGRWTAVAGLIGADAPPPAVATADALAADLMLTPGALARLLAAPATAAEVVAGLAPLLAGPVPRGDGPAAGWRTAIAAAIAAGRLPETDRAANAVIVGLLDSPDPLVPDQTAPAHRAMSDLVLAVIGADGVAGGGEVAGALTRRYARRSPHGGAAGLRFAVIGLTESLDRLLPRLRYLAALIPTPEGRTARAAVLESLDAALAHPRLVPGLLADPTPTHRQIARLAAVAEAIGRSDLPEAQGVPRAAAIAALCDRVAHREGPAAAPATGPRDVSVRALTALAAAAALRRAAAGHAPGAAVAAADLTAARPAPPPSWPAAARPKPAADAAAVTGTPTLAPSAPAASGVWVDALARRSGDDEPASRRCVSCFAPHADDGPCPRCGFDPRSGRRPAVHLPPGSLLLGRYRVGRLLGHGGFGATHQGWDERLDIRVAIKEFHPPRLVTRAPNGTTLVPLDPECAATFQEDLAKFLDEARVLARLRAIREIVGVQDVFEDNGTAYLVMDFLEGRTLRDYVAETGTRIDYRRALGVLAPVMRALHAVHRAGVIHRDVSPDNVLVTRTGEARLIDFGAARFASRGEQDGFTVVFKPGFAPPEQYVRDIRQGPWTDVYGVSATLYFAITGERPLDVTRRLIADTLARPRARGVDTPAGFDDALMRGLALRVADRFQDMKALLGAFARIARGERRGAPGGPGPPAGPDRIARSGPATRPSGSRR